MKDSYLNGKIPNTVSGVVAGKPVGNGGGVKGQNVEVGMGSKKSGSLPSSGKKSINGNLK